MFRLNPHDVHVVLQNLYAIRKNKDFIISSSIKYFQQYISGDYNYRQQLKHNITLPDFLRNDKSSFVLKYGMCFNADVWRLGDGNRDHINQNNRYVDPTQIIDFVTWMGAVFIYRQNYGDIIWYHQNITASTPISANHDDRQYKMGEKWQNPLRWEYVDFWIEMLELHTKQGYISKGTK